VQKLDKAPLIQDNYYRAWLQRIENSGPSFNVARRMLAWISLTPSYRKLTVSEIRHAMAFRLGSRVLSGEHEYLTDINRLISHCKGTVEYDLTIEGVISVPDGLRDYLKSGKWEGFFDVEEMKKDMAHICIEYLSDDNVFVGQPNREEVQGLKVRLWNRRELYPFTEYAEEFWHYYSRKVDDSILYDRVLEFLDKGPDVSSMYWPLPTGT
jgi:hypothetical protein